MFIHKTVSGQTAVKEKRKGKGMRLLAGFCAALLLLGGSGCSGLKTYMLSELLPEVIDDATLLARVDAVTVTRFSDGSAVTLEGAALETLMMSFENVTCIRVSEKKAYRPDYTLDFTMSAPGESVPPLQISRLYENAPTRFTLGEEAYETINMTLDPVSLESLFG